MHYTVAAALLHDQVGFETFKENTNLPGSPENPLSNQHLKQKFMNYAWRAIGPESASQVYEQLSSLRNMDSVSKVLSDIII